MDLSELRQIVRQEVAVVVGVPEAQLQNDSDLRTDYELDSLELLEIGSRLETAIDIRIDAHNLGKIHSIDDVATLLHEQMGDS